MTTSRNLAFEGFVHVVSLVVGDFLSAPVLINVTPPDFNVYTNLRTWASPFNATLECVTRVMKVLFAGGDFRKDLTSNSLLLPASLPREKERLPWRLKGGEPPNKKKTERKTERYQSVQFHFLRRIATRNETSQTLQLSFFCVYGSLPPPPRTRICLANPWKAIWYANW